MALVSLSAFDTQKQSPMTTDRYKRKMNFLMATFNKTPEWILTHPTDMHNLLTQKYDNPKSLVGYITPICKLLAIHPIFMKRNAKAYEAWKDLLLKYNRQVRATYNKNQMTENQRENMVEFEALKRKFCELQRDAAVESNFKLHMQYVLFAVFLNTIPKRADLGEVYVSRNHMLPKRFLQKNYILLRDTDPVLVLNDYKTRKTYGTLTEALKPELVTILKRSFELFPRDYLIMSNYQDDLRPYTKKNSYSQFVKRAFKKHFDAAMGVSLWRRVYIAEHVSFDKQTNEEIMKNARLAGHSLETQMRVYKSTNIKKRSEEEKARASSC